MKHSVSLSIFRAAPSTPALFSGGTERNVARIKELGFDGVDLFVENPHSEDTRATIDLLRKYNLQIGAIMPAALAAQGLTLGSPDAAVRSKCISRLCQIVHLAEQCGAMVSIGLVRGSKCPEERMTCFEDRFLDACVQLLQVSEPAGVPLLIEPINRYEINTILSVRDGIDFIQRSGLPMYLMNDLFHMNIEDVDMEGMLLQALPYTKHIHFLDSNRLSPGMGHLDMERYYRLLEAAGYDGFLCLEVLPMGISADECAVRGAEFFASMKQ